MRDGERKNAKSGGVLLAFSILAGVFWGLYEGEPSMGFLIGTAIGLALLLLVWLLDRR